MTDLFPEVVETDRLRLERFDLAVDPLDYYEICAHDEGIEEATRYVLWEPHDHPKETFEYVERVGEHWREGEHPSYAIYLREGEPDAGTLAGACDLHVGWDRRTGELGIWLRRRFWGRGYSGERAAALLELAFDRLDLELAGITLRTDNERSKRAVERYVERFGGQLDGRFRNHWSGGGEVHDAYRYSITCEQYRENRPEDLGVRFYDDVARAPERPTDERADATGGVDA